MKENWKRNMNHTHPCNENRDKIPSKKHQSLNYPQCYMKQFYTKPKDKEDIGEDKGTHKSNKRQTNNTITNLIIQRDTGLPEEFRQGFTNLIKQKDTRSPEEFRQGSGRNH